MKTKVLFVKEDGLTIAVFPSLKWDKVGNLTCYAHVGQHGPLSLSYFQGLEVVENPAQYLELKKELTSIGYDLRIVNEQGNTILRNTLKTK